MRRGQFIAAPAIAMLAQQLRAQSPATAQAFEATQVAIDDINRRIRDLDDYIGRLFGRDAGGTITFDTNLFLLRLGNSAVASIGSGLYTQLLGSQPHFVFENPPFKGMTAIQAGGVSYWYDGKNLVSGGAGFLGGTFGLTDIGQTKYVNLSGITGEIQCSGRIRHGVPNTIPPSGDLAASEASPYIDETAHTISWKVKYSDGTTVKTGTVALV